MPDIISSEHRILYHSQHLPASVGVIFVPIFNIIDYRKE
nr:MAG TPA: hypothetical protein [Caudoviricetes sp.]